MIDISYFQNTADNVQIFQNGGTWQTWVKPKNATQIFILIVGAGAGGGGGFLAAGTRGGGGSGGSGAITKFIIPAALVPDILYVYPGRGGTGGNGGNPATAGSAGERSFVCLNPSFTDKSYILISSGTGAATGGSAGTTAGGFGGGAETLFTTAVAPLSLLGTFTSIVGLNGTSGGTGGGTATSAGTITCSGTGGGGTGTGGAITATGGALAIVPQFSATPINTNGRSGTIIYKPTLVLIGGSGGGGGTTGGRGGNGAPGTSGGGGGGGTSSAGNGGNGGDGLVIITTI